MVGWVAGWVDDSFRKYCHFVAPSCKLELARFSALLRIQDGAECGNIADMDKYPQDKCCLDKHRSDSCNLLYMFPGTFV